LNTYAWLQQLVETPYTYPVVTWAILTLEDWGYAELWIWVSEKTSYETVRKVSKALLA